MAAMERIGLPDVSGYFAFIGVIAFIPVAIILGVLLLRIVRARRDAGGAAGWQAAPGRILESRVVSRTRHAAGKILHSHYPHVVYEYAVGSQRYVGERLAFGHAVGLGVAAWVQRRLAKYPAGAACTVYYDPADPAEAVLERRTAANPILWVAIAVIAVTSAGGLLMLGFAFAVLKMFGM